MALAQRDLADGHRGGGLTGFDDGQAGFAAQGFGIIRHARAAHDQHIRAIPVAQSGGNRDAIGARAVDEAVATVATELAEAPEEAPVLAEDDSEVLTV